LKRDLPAAPSGTVYALLAYTAWGLLPIYWKLFGQIPPVEVLSHRVLWSMLFLVSLLWLRQQWQRKPEMAELRQIWQTPRSLGILLATAALLTFNWGLYIYGVNTDRVVETSLGYFVNPLVSVVLGFVFLKERLTRAQGVAVGLAAIGVGYSVWQFGQVPAIALGLAFSFAFYGLLRKIVPVAPLAGLAIETLLITPIAFLLVSYWAATGVGHLGGHWRVNLLFIGAGVVTSLPLLWFNTAAKRLRLSTLGLFQYVAPSLQLLLGVWLYREPFTHIHAVTFGCIWSALLIFSLSAARRRS